MDGKKFMLKRTSLTVSLKCNLRCKLCAAYAPYYANCKAPALSEIMEYVHNYFKIVDFVEIFTITGGEPLLYTQLPELLDKLNEYSEQFEKLEIISNGSILPNCDQLNAVKKLRNKFSRFLFDNYGEELSSKIEEIKTMLNDFDIPYEIRNHCNENLHCGGWIDFGELKESIHSQQAAADLFSKCAYPQKLKFCFNIIDGCLIPCPPVYRRKSLGCSKNDNDFVDLTDSTLTVQEQQNKILNMYKRPLDACMYCNGMCDDSLRYTPAEQFTVEELKNISQQLFGG